MRVLLMAALMASPLLAQDNNANRGQEFMVNRLKDRLKLTDEQTAGHRALFGNQSHRSQDQRLCEE